MEQRHAKRVFSVPRIMKMHAILRFYKAEQEPSINAYRFLSAYMLCAKSKGFDQTAYMRRLV